MSSEGPAGPLLRRRPLGLGEILDDVFRVYRRRFWLLLLISLVVSLPSLVLQFASGSASQLGFTFSILTNLGNPNALLGREPPGLPNPWLVVVGYLLLIVLVPFSFGAILRAAIDVLQGRPVSVGSALRGVARRYWALMGVALLYLLISPLALCLPVFIWLVVRWAVAVPALLEEGVGPIRALDRSWVLTSGHWWRLFGILVLIYLLTTVVSGALVAFALPVAVAPFISADVRGAIFLTVETAAGAVVQPALYLVLALLYFDLRIRREPVDVTPQS